MSADNNQQTILIGGLNSAVGGHVARLLHAKGFRVGGFARDEKKLSKLQDDLGDDLWTRTLDATDAAAIDGFFDDAVNELGTIDGYLHAVGSIFIKAPHLMKDEEWNETLQLNLTSAFYALRAGVKRMQKQKSGGCMVFVSTVAARVGVANHEAIAAAKGGLEAMVRSAASSYVSRSLRFNAVAPALMDTPMAQPIVGHDTGRQISEKMNPLGRIGDPAEVASLIAWMLSPEARWMTGQIVSLDGGMSTVLPKPKA